MKTLREAAYTALNVLDDWVYDPQCQKQIDQAINTLRAALAQPEPEPVAWWHDMGDERAKRIEANKVRHD